MRTAVVGMALAALIAGRAEAASLQVAPVLLDLPAPGNTTTITLRNTGVEPITAQVRVFRWSQRDGTERLEPTDEVVASPPVVQLRSRQDYTVRVVRVVGGPAGGEAAFRLVVDELPKPNPALGTVALVMRHVVPVFFTDRSASPAAVTWSVSRHGKGFAIGAANSGDRRVRLAAVTVRDSSGKVVAANKGLLGYSLGRSAMQWVLPAQAESKSARFTISGMTEAGPFNATLPMSVVR